jgi:hypothetical protein
LSEKLNKRHGKGKTPSDSSIKNKETEVNATLMHHPGCFSESFFTEEEDDNGKQFKYAEVIPASQFLHRS